MAEKTLTARFKQKVDTSTNWAANNPILLVGEIGCESDTFKIKVGDGSTAWNSLSYVIADVTIDTALDESSSNAIANSAATAAINENATNLSDFIDISAGRIVTDADTGYVGEIFNDYENNVSSGKYSHAEGYKTTASGAYTHAEGVLTVAQEYSEILNDIDVYYGSAHAEGYHTQATGGSSHAEGGETQATMFYAHAEGYGTVASGRHSHAENSYTTASGDGSHASGYVTIADQKYQTAVGMLNLEGQEGSLFVVGNGTDKGGRSNAFEVFQDGTIQVNGGTITYDSSTDTFTI